VRGTRLAKPRAAIRTIWIVGLTMVSAACMVASLMVLVGILEKRGEYRELYGEIGTSVIVLYSDHRGTRGHTPVAEYLALREIAERLDRVSGVFAEYGVSGGRRSTLKLLRNGMVAEATVKGVDAEYGKLMGYTMKAGRFLQEGDEFRAVAVLSERFAEELGGGVHDCVRLWGREFEIIGVVAHPKPRPFCVSRVNVSIRKWEDVFVPVEMKRQEIERQLAAGDMPPFANPWARVYLVYTPSRMLAFGRRAAIVDQAEKLLEATFGPRGYLVGERMTAYGYVNFVALAFGAGFLFLFGICALVFGRSLRSFFSLADTLLVPAQATRLLLLASGMGGVAAGLPLSRLIMEGPPLPAVPALVSLVIVLPLQLLITRRILRKLPT
jgi:hypothetical protein